MNIILLQCKAANAWAGQPRPHLCRLQVGPSHFDWYLVVWSSVEILSPGGWQNINNISQEFQQPFQLYREQEQTYLQWMGRESLHQSLEGRVVLVQLLCKEAARTNRKLFSPCISFRIAGSPGQPVQVHSRAGHSCLNNWIGLKLQQILLTS